MCARVVFFFVNLTARKLFQPHYLFTVTLLHPLVSCIFSRTSSRLLICLFPCSNYEYCFFPQRGNFWTFLILLLCRRWASIPRLFLYSPCKAMRATWQSSQKAESATFCKWANISFTCLFSCCNPLNPLNGIFAARWSFQSGVDSAGWKSLLRLCERFVYWRELRFSCVSPLTKINMVCRSVPNHRPPCQCSTLSVWWANLDTGAVIPSRTLPFCTQQKEHLGFFLTATPSSSASTTP